MLDDPFCLYQTTARRVDGFVGRTPLLGTVHSDGLLVLAASHRDQLELYAFRLRGDTLEVEFKFSDSGEFPSGLQSARFTKAER